MNDYFHNDTFKDYYLNNRGKKYKSFGISINNYQYDYDIYWGDPSKIFDSKTIKLLLPLAVTAIPHRNNYPNPRIFLHEKLEDKNDAFVLVVAHEIGHLWLHDIIGFNNPSTFDCMDETESEKWADYFSYCFFRKYRNVTDYENFSSMLRDVSVLQTEIYDLDDERSVEMNYSKRNDDLKTLVELINTKSNEINQFESQMNDRADITLASLGDIFI